MLPGLHRAATNEGGRGTNLPADPELLSSQHQTTLPKASRGLALLVPAEPTLEKLPGSAES